MRHVVHKVGTPSLAQGQRTALVTTSMDNTGQYPWTRCGVGNPWDTLAAPLPPPVLYNVQLPVGQNHPRYGIRMRVHDRYRQAQSRSAKQKSKRKALQ